MQTERQPNGSDCGVHSIIFMICIALFGSINADPSKLLISILKHHPESIRLGLILLLLIRAASIHDSDLKGPATVLHGNERETAQ